jgi:hypothetical protein
LNLLFILLASLVIHYFLIKLPYITLTMFHRTFSLALAVAAFTATCAAFSPALINSNVAFFTTKQRSMSLSLASALADEHNSVLVVGSANQDLTSTTDILPVLGETVMGNDFSTACGGKGANQAVAAACLGVSPVSMVCRVGDDIFGQNLLDNFRKSSYFLLCQRSSSVQLRTYLLTNTIMIITSLSCRSSGCSI